MAVSGCALAERKMYGMSYSRFSIYQYAYNHSGAYCSMVMISLLALPLELPPNAPARAHGLTSFLDGLPEYLSRCLYPGLKAILLS